MENQLAEQVDVDPEGVNQPAAEEAQPEPEQEAAEAEEHAEEQAPEKRTDEPPKVGEDLIKKIEKLERRQLYLQRQLEKERSLANYKAPEPEEEQQAKTTDAPKEDDFDTYEEYQEALVDYKIQKGIDDYIAKQQQNNSQAVLQEFVQEVTEIGLEKYPDFEDVAMAANVPITQTMIQILQDCENPADVAYYLGKNGKECVAISRMTRDAAVRAIAKIDYQIGQEGGGGGPAPATTIKPVSKAPPPIKPARTSSGVVTKDPSKMSQAEYEAWRASGGGK